MDIQLCQVRIENLRSIKSADVKLNSFSVMFGMNDSGKSNFLLAIELALGNKYITEKDVFRSETIGFKFDTSVIIDLKFIPVDANLNRLETFNDLWGLYLGDSIATEIDNEYFAFRTKFTFDSDKNNYRRERLLLSWDDTGVKESKLIGSRILSAFEFIYLDAQRDISADLRDKASLWSKEVAKMEMPLNAKREIEASLTTLGAQIMKKSPFLTQAATDLSISTNNIKSNIAIHPITRTVDEIYKGLDIYVSGSGSSEISIANMGSGTRSRAVLSTLRTVINTKMAYADKMAAPFFAIIAFEEPEVHIHPQAQRRLIHDFNNINSQRIITTHSPYVLSSSNIQDLIYVALENAQTRFSPLSNLGLDKEELDKVKRLVIDTHGEILFAKLVVFAEGDTERLALPIFFKERFKYEPYELGISIVGTGGEGNFSTFARIFKSIDVSWFIFCDGDVKKKLVAHLKKLEKTEGELDVTQYPNVIILDEPYNYEEYLVNRKYVKNDDGIYIDKENDGYMSEIIESINEYEPKPYAKLPEFEFFAKKDHQTNCTKCDIPVWNDASEGFCCHDGKKQALIACMEKKKNKTKYAIPIAIKICTSYTDIRKYPPKIKHLFDEINKYVDMGARQ